MRLAVSQIDGVARGADGCAANCPVNERERAAAGQETVVPAASVVALGENVADRVGRLHKACANAKHGRHAAVVRHDLNADCAV